MIRIVSRKVGLRPSWSPSRPNTRAPKGRTTKPAPKVARLERKPVVASPAGKKSFPSSTAKEP